MTSNERSHILELSIARHRSKIMDKLEAKSKRQTLLINHQDFIKENRKYKSLLEIHRKGRGTIVRKNSMKTVTEDDREPPSGGLGSADQSP